MAGTSRVTEVLIVAVKESAGSTLYGMVDVLNAAGSLWQTLARAETPRTLFRVRIAAPARKAFRCGNNVPIVPDVSIADDPAADIVILPELWLGPDEALKGRYPEVMEWLRRRYRKGSALYSACSGAVMLAETGLLDGREATSHWGYQELFRKCYPRVRFDPAPSLAFAEPGGRIVTAGGATSWHDLALHIIARYASPGEALRIAKVYLLKWHGEGQLPYAALVRRNPHADSAVRKCEDWLAKNFRHPNAVAQAVATIGIPERTLKRRFKGATGATLMDRLQDLRVEHAKRLLEKQAMAVDAVSAAAGYEDASFFRRIFRRRTGLAPSEYRRMFQHTTAR
ncbi:MAG TPA: helix-turn-helix domain-containing protein [Steroidobacteraceae bacterium]|nr:helix-turn-helix domain-containing protein [Steroidobacteraceae bacterium]